MLPVQIGLPVHSPVTGKFTCGSPQGSVPMI